MQTDFLLALAEIGVNFFLPFLAVAGRFWSLKRTPKAKWPDVAWRGVFVVLAAFYAGAFFAPLFGWEDLAWLNPAPYRRGGGGPLAGLVVSLVMAAISTKRFRAELAANQISN